MPLASPRTEHSYIAVAAFNGSIFQYSTQLNSITLKREGKLTSISATPTGVALSAVNCPPGRILRETGNKLYPGTHPGLAVGDTFGGATVGTTATNKYWVLVYDAQTGVRGFIDPNGPIFTTYSTDKAIEISDALESAGGAATRLGGPIFTAGNITTTGGSVIQQKPVLAAGTGILTLTAAQTVGGVVTQTPTSTQAVNLPATADIISAMGSYVGTTSEFIYINTSANVATVTAGDGSTTLVGVVTVAATTSARFIIRIATSTTVVLYRA